MTKKQCGIYKIYNKINGKSYIGQTISYTKRKSGHIDSLNRNTHHNTHLQSAWNKYGKDAFIFSLVLLCEPNELDFYEQKLVDIFIPQYNLRKECVSSNRGIKHSIQYCIIQSKAQKGKVLSEEHKKKISEGLIRSGSAGGMKGKHQSEETKTKIRNWYAALSEEEKQLRSLEIRSRVVSEETKLKISKNNGRGNLGKKLPKESIEKRTKTRRERHGNYSLSKG